jgi:hypothetical protein
LVIAAPVPPQPSSAYLALIRSQITGIIRSDVFKAKKAFFDALVEDIEIRAIIPPEGGMSAGAGRETSGPSRRARPGGTSQKEEYGHNCPNRPISAEQAA